MLSALFNRVTKNVSLLVVACILVAGCINTGLTDHGDSGGDNHDAGPDAAMHDTYDVPDGMALPSLTLSVIKDAKAGYNVHVTTANFRFAPEHASSAHVMGEGHAHIYVDGVKINRLYGEWYHIPELHPGEHVVSVALSTNDHRFYTRGGEHIAAEQKVNVP